jgi:hypothetical protein
VRKGKKSDFGAGWEAILPIMPESRPENGLEIETQESEAAAGCGNLNP